MGRRMKSIVALLMVLALLYWQQDELGYEISYAAEEETEEEPEGEKLGDSQEEPEEKPQIRKYEIVIPEADGQNGYYISCPVIKIRHVSEAGKTLCRLTDHTGRIFEQTLEHTGDMAEFGKEHFSEGENWSGFPVLIPQGFSAKAERQTVFPPIKKNPSRFSGVSRRDRIQYKLF